jgi:hypothetical protein
MKKRIWIALSSDLLAKIEQLAGSRLSPSALIERVLRTHFSEPKRGAMHARDFARINAAADRLNAEADDVLAYQRTKI